MGVVLPEEGFLQGVRRTEEYGELLIFDEVITGFRVGYGGAQAHYGVDPDLTCLGKIIGGGLPVGAYGGKRRFMEQVAPSGPVYQAGTLAGNPLAMNAGLATLKILQRPGIYDALTVRRPGWPKDYKSLAYRKREYQLGLTLSGQCFLCFSLTFRSRIMPVPVRQM